jgi:peroxiredoxin
LPDINGNRVSLSKFKNQKIILAFWSSWNKVSLNAVLGLSKKLENQDVVLILIALDNAKDKWETAVKNNFLEKHINLSDLKAWESPVAKIYAVKSIPSFLLIDENQNLVAISDDYNEIIDNLNKN